LTKGRALGKLGSVAVSVALFGFGEVSYLLSAPLLLFAPRPFQFFSHPRLNENQNIDS